MDEIPGSGPSMHSPLNKTGKTLIYLKDPLNLATPIGISPVGYFILAHFDGRHSVVDIQEATPKSSVHCCLSNELKTFVDMLDEHYYLQSERFQKHQDFVVEEFRRLPTRPAAHVGGVYQADPVELVKQLDGFFTAAQGPGLPERQMRAPTPRAIVAPHIDFHRGGPAYAWAYKSLAESAGADLYILLGTSHCSGRSPYILTLKDFETPLGLVETDREFVQNLQASCAEDCFADEYLHRGEHSLEFQVVLLKYIAQKRAELTGQPEKPFKIVPILVSSFHSSVVSQTLPDESPASGEFSDVAAWFGRARFKRDVCFIAGVDLGACGTAVRRP